jgi:hypothetical protein
MTSVGVGAIVGSVLSGFSLIQRNAARLVLVLPIALGASVAALGLAPSMPLAMLALAAVGLCSIGYMSLANANIQLAAREELVGRVMGLWTVVQAGMMPLGSLGLGALGDLAGLPATLALAGVATALVAVGLGRRPRALPAAEGNQRGADAEQQDGGRHVGRPLEVGRPAR